MNKQDLYVEIERIRNDYHLPPTPPYNSRKICSNIFELNLDETTIRTVGLRGISHIPSRTVIVGANMSNEEKNFYCMHEIMHHFLHRNRKSTIYSDYDKVAANQNQFVEWQANEGAAQFLMPYQTFIPDYVHTCRKHARDSFPIVFVTEELSDKYFVTPKVVQTRIANLNYEIYQYLQGVPISNIDIRSASALRAQKWNQQHEKSYCKNCLSPITDHQVYCHICRSVLEDGIVLHRLGAVAKGAGYMTYKGIELDHARRAIECPICGNTEAFEDGTHCIICGNSLVNMCAEDEEFQTEHCYMPLPGNARFCPYCGGKSSFLSRAILRPWDYKDPSDFFGDIDENEPFPF